MGRGTCRLNYPALVPDDDAAGTALPSHRAHPVLYRIQSQHDVFKVNNSYFLRFVNLHSSTLVHVLL